jgi:Domain of Unknown Function with PDB structure (DUF3857)/Transglutaminase-like superfamily
MKNDLAPHCLGLISAGVTLARNAYGLRTNGFASLASRSLAAVARVLTVLWLGSALAAGQSWDKWKPIEADLSSPRVEKDADAEALFWEVWVQDHWDGHTLNNIRLNSIRVKIFNERGREAQSKVDITYGKRTRVSDIAGRTIKKDRTIIELKKDGIFERTIAKASGVKVTAKSFVLPNVEPGDMIEYRWRETSTESSANYMRLNFQREIPIHLVKYYIKPLTSDQFPYQMRMSTFQGERTPLQRELNEFWSTSMSNMPAFREEPYMPPEASVRTWMLIYYSEDKKLDAQKYWKEHGKDVYKNARSRMKANDEVQSKTAALTSGASDPDSKLARLFDFCRTQIKNIYDDASGITADDRSKLKDNKSPADTLKTGKGDGMDINYLFAAMATAAGFDARMAAMPDRSDMYFVPGFVDSYFLPSQSVAVKIGEKWRFFDPASRFVPFGMLRWQEEGVPALVSDPKDPVFVTTDLAAPGKSARRRTASFRLAEDGTLEGDVKVESIGHLAAAAKELNDAKSANEREEELKENLRSRLSTAEVSNVVLEDASDPLKPHVISYRVKIPGYAVRTGRRLFLQPGYFQRGLSPYFSTSTRKHDIQFDYPWSESDSVTFELPEGFALDNADAPAKIPGEVAGYNVQMTITPDQRTLTYKRDFFVGGKETLFFPANMYPQVKAVFDMVHQGDNHTITLKIGEGAQSSKAGN